MASCGLATMKRITEMVAVDGVTDTRFFLGSKSYSALS
jgi:hypothetical protein